MTKGNVLTDGDLSGEVQAVIDKIEEKDVDFPRLQLISTLGTAKNAPVLASQAEKAFTEGIYFDDSSIDGFVCIQESDMRLKPNPSTFAILPWRKKENSAAGRLICDVFNTSIGEPFSNDPCGVLKHAIERARELGYDVNVAPKPGLFLSEEGEDGRATTVMNDVGDHFDLTSKDLVSDVRHSIIYGLENMGFNIEASHHEVAESQHEINFMYGDAPSAADNVVTLRSIVRAITIGHDLHAAFIFKLILHINGSGIHTYISLFKDGESALYDGDNEFDLSDTAKSFVVGILDHVPAITTAADPTVNSYKCPAPGYEAPVYIVWFDRNRLAFICKSAARTLAAPYIEARFLGLSCNPYLVFAALTHIGLDGVGKGLDCLDPVRENIYKPDETKREEYGIETLSKDPGGAIDTLEEDKVTQEILGDHVFEKFAEARYSEFKDYLVDASQWKPDRYLETF